MTWIKICGLTNLADAQMVASLGADAFGFIFAPSKRQVEPEKVREIVACLPQETEKIGVFMDKEVEEVKAIARFCGLTGLQFHGRETPEYCKEFQEYKVIKGFRVDAENGWDKIAAYIRNNAINRILLDTYVPGVPGGTGKTFDWKIVTTKRKDWGKIPFILAGGLNSENVAQAIKEVGPWGIDVASGIESAPGKKDEEKLKRLITEARQVAKTGRGSNCGKCLD